MNGIGLRAIVLGAIAGRAARVVRRSGTIVARCARRGHLALGAAVLLLAWADTGSAGDFENGRQLYGKLCARCHGQIAEQRQGAAPLGPLHRAVMTTLGPGLSGVYGRPAGTVPGYRYSNAFRKVAAGLVWDTPTLDRWLANSQAMIPGSYMFLEVEPGSRGEIIHYLAATSRYQG